MLHAAGLAVQSRLLANTAFQVALLAQHSAPEGRAVKVCNAVRGYSVVE